MSFTISLLNAVMIDVKLQEHPAVENVFIKVQSRKLPSITIGCMYRHPKADTDSFHYITEVLRNMCLQKRTTFILGDLKDNLLAPNSRLSRIIGNRKLTADTQTHSNHTHLSTLLDVIITNRPDHVIHVDVVPGVIEDHDLITVTADISKSKRELVTKVVRDLSTNSSDSFCSHLLSHAPTLNTILQSDDVDAQVDILTTIFTSTLNTCAPMTTRKISRPHAPWIDDDIREAMSARNQAQTIPKRDHQNPTLQNH